MKKSTTFAVTPEEQSLIESMLDFANMESINSTSEVEDLFRRNVSLVGDVFQVIPPTETGAFVRDQLELRRWLELITKSRAGRKTVGAEVAALLGTVATRATFQEDELRVAFGLRGVQACYAYAVAVILDRRRKLANKLGRCGWSKCGKFQLNFSAIGRPRKHCNAQHKWRAEAERRT